MQNFALPNWLMGHISVMGSWCITLDSQKRINTCYVIGNFSALLLSASPQKMKPNNKT